MKTIILTALLTGCTVTAPIQPINPIQPIQYDSREEYIKNRNQDQIMNHGSGGCTPNFSTGGCL